jgi:arginase
MSISEKNSGAPALSLIGLPYLYGLRQALPRNHMALGPGSLLSNVHLQSGIKELYSDIETVMIEDADDPRPDETAGYYSFNVTGLFAGDQLSRTRVQVSRLAEQVRRARDAGRIVLAATGACSAAVGMVAGLGADEDIGMVWFDAHDDSRTPETSTTGLMDGMPVAMIAGQCWQAYCSQVPGFRPIPLERILTLGLHEKYEAEGGRKLMLKNIVDPSAIRKQGFDNAVVGALDDLAKRCRKVYVHVDLDVLDPEVAIVAHHMATGGWTIDQLHFALSATAERFEIVGLDYSCFDPSLDDKAADVLAKSMVFASRAIWQSLSKV